jgi:hypothetical protein
MAGVAVDTDDERSATQNNAECDGQVTEAAKPEAKLELHFSATQRDVPK